MLKIIGICTGLVLLLGGAIMAGLFWVGRALQSPYSDLSSFDRSIAWSLLAAIVGLVSVFILAFRG